MIDLRRGIRRLAKKVDPGASSGVVHANSPGQPDTAPAGARSDAAEATGSAARRQVLALWWILRLASDAPEHEITYRAAALWRQTGGSAQPSDQRWRRLVNAVQEDVAEPARRTVRLRVKKGIVPQDRVALALILGGHSVAEVAYLEHIAIRDVHRRLRTGLTSLG